MDEADLQLYNQIIFELTEYIFSRYFRGSLIVQSWAIFEASIKEIANKLGNINELQVRFSDIFSFLL
jgi:hypothetical protein